MLSRVVLACFLALVAAPSAVFAAPLRVVGYVPTWTLDKVPPAAFDKLTDVIIFSAEISAAGHFPEHPVPDDTLAKYHAAKEEHGFRLHLCFGGWGRSGGFAAMATDPLKREDFIRQLSKYCVARKIDGIDYDWEFPRDAPEKAAYDELITQTKEAVAPGGLEVSVALGFSQVINQRARDAVDHVHLMTYDMGTRHATLEDTKAVVERLIRRGVPARKLCLGVPFYGRKLDDREVSTSYSNLVEQYHPAPEVDEIGGFYFNGPVTIREKVRFAAAMQLGGIMIWEISADTSDATSLLRVIDAEVERAAAARSDKTP